MYGAACGEKLSTVNWERVAAVTVYAASLKRCRVRRE